MKVNVSNPIRFKDGSEWTKGTPVIIEVKQDRPTRAILENLHTGEIKQVRSTSLNKWFDEFIEISQNDLELAVYDCECPSLLGDNVEPDGWDSEGMPSILLACGIC